MSIGTDYVVGGVGSPRIVETGDNLCLNPRLRTDKTGWTSNTANLVLTRVENTDAYEEYMLKVTHTQPTYDYIKYTASLGQTLTSLDNKKILVAMRISHNKGGGEILGLDEIPTKINLVSSGGTFLGSKEILINTSVKRIAILFEGNWTSPAAGPCWRSEPV